MNDMITIVLPRYLAWLIQLVLVLELLDLMFRAIIWVLKQKVGTIEIKSDLLDPTPEHVLRFIKRDNHTWKVTTKPKGDTPTEDES